MGVCRPLPGERVARSSGALLEPRRARRRRQKQCRSRSGKRGDVARRRRPGRRRTRRRFLRGHRRRRRRPARPRRAPAGAHRTGRARAGTGMTATVASPRAASSCGWPRYPSRHSARSPAARRSGSRGIRGSPATRRRAPGTSSTAATASGQALVVADDAEGQHGVAVVGPLRGAAEDGVRDYPQLSLGDTESGERAASALAVDDDRVEAPEEPSPGRPVARCPAGQQVVGGEDERRPRSAGARRRCRARRPTGGGGRRTRQGRAAREREGARRP